MDFLGRLVLCLVHASCIFLGLQLVCLSSCKNKKSEKINIPEKDKSGKVNYADLSKDKSGEK